MRPGAGTELSPEQVERLGREEVARLEGELEPVLEQLGRGDLQLTVASLASDTSQVTHSPSQINVEGGRVTSQTTQNLKSLCCGAGVFQRCGGHYSV